MNRQDALALVEQYVSNENLVRHMLAVEAAMQFYANKYGEDELTWGITGKRVSPGADAPVRSRLASSPGSPCHPAERSVVARA